MKLLIGYDGSGCAKTAIDDLRRSGLPADVEAVVLTVADVLPGLLVGNADPLSPGSRLAIEEFMRPAIEAAEQAIAEARATSQQGCERVQRLFPQWNVRAEAVGDSPYWALIRRAGELHADLVVVGSQGRSTIQRAILGSVSQNVLQHAPCSVRVGRDDGGDPSSPVRVLLGVDGSVGSAVAVSAVAGRRWPAGSKIRVVTATDQRLLLLMLGATASTMSSLAPRYRAVRPPEDQHEGARRLVGAVAEELASTGLPVSTAVHEGDPKRVLLAEAEEWPADCVFVGAQGLTRIERLLIGSVSSSVAARAHCTVEVVRNTVL